MLQFAHHFVLVFILVLTRLLIKNIIAFRQLQIAIILIIAISLLNAAKFKFKNIRPGNNIINTSSC